MMNKKKTSLGNLGKYALSLPIFALLLLSSNAWSASQRSNTASTKATNIAEKPLTVAEIMPKFPGGEKTLKAFISKNLEYPVSAAQSGIQGRVIVRFIVKKTGEVADVKVVRGLDAACDNEAVRVVKLLPNWTPGKQDKRNVSVYYTLPITFRLKK
jgi:periplasmic protein TonB